ncbi:MAG: MarR family transcriptional regulator, partial [Bacteroidales bacterium]|nr:MarR family transcriptional regulator [Bacteroidales bacterium]
DIVKDNRNMRIVYNYIARHPNCKAADIKTRGLFSQTTVNRILGQLKKEGLIEYQGSKKYGGYKIVES